MNQDGRRIIDYQNVIYKLYEAGDLRPPAIFCIQKTMRRIRRYYNKKVSGAIYSTILLK